MSNIPDERGRDRVVSTGRGGAGNLIRSPSRGVDPEVVPGAERGREISTRDASTDGRVTHSGRGGAGNIRSPSRDPAARRNEEREEALQEQLVAEARGRQAEAKFSTGRGGVGNIRDSSQSRSRSAVREKIPAQNGSPHVGHGGRGGWGNLVHSDDKSIDQSTLDHEAKIAAKHHADEAGKPYFSGKGGAGNFNQPHEPVDLSTLTLEEREAHAKVHPHKGGFVSGGRGGAGNIHAASSDERRGRGEHNHENGMFKNVLRSLSRSVQGREKSSDRKEAV